MERGFLGVESLRTFSPGLRALDPADARPRLWGTCLSLGPGHLGGVRASPMKGSTVGGIALPAFVTTRLEHRIPAAMDLRYCVHPLEYVLGQLHVQGGETGVELLGFAGADDWRRDCRLVERPGDGQRGQLDAQLLGNS